MKELCYSLISYIRDSLYDQPASSIINGCYDLFVPIQGHQKSPNKVNSLLFK
jgi:hypothetical protein